MVKNFLYKVIMFPTRFHPFFKYGTPYCFEGSMKDKDFYTYYKGWYFNCKNPFEKNYEIGKVFNRYVGHRKSIIYTYKQILKLMKI